MKLTMNYQDHCEKVKARDKALSVIANYLRLAGWSLYNGPDNNIVFYGWIDPLDGQVHRSDLAFLLQTERDASFVRDSEFRK